MSDIQVWDKDKNPTAKGGHGGDRANVRKISFKDAHSALQSKCWKIAETKKVTEKKGDEIVEREVVVAIMPVVEEKPKKEKEKKGKPGPKPKPEKPTEEK